MAAMIARHKTISLMILIGLLAALGVYASAAILLGGEAAKRIQTALVDGLRSSLQRDVSVGNVDVSLPNSVIVSDLKIAKGEKMDDGVMAVIPKASVNLNLFDLLVQRSEPINSIKSIVFEKAEIAADIDAKDGLNIDDFLNMPDKGIGTMDFSGDIAFKDALLKLKISNVKGLPESGVIDEKIFVSDMVASFKKKNLAVLNAGINVESLGNALFSVKGQYQQNNGKYKLSGEGSGINLGALITRIPLQLSNISLNQGIANVNASLSGGAGEPVKYSGQIHFTDVAGEYSGLLPIGLREAKGDIIFSQDSISVAALDGKTLGGSISLNGKIKGRRAKVLDMDLTGKNLFISDKEAGELFGKGFSWSGKGDASVKVSGALISPVITGYVNLDKASVAVPGLKDKVDFKGRLDVDGDTVKFENLSCLLDGSAGSISGMLYGFKEPAFDITGLFNKFNIASVNGLLRLTKSDSFTGVGKHAFHVSGYPSAFKWVGSLDMPRGTVFDAKVEEFSGEYQWIPGKFEITGMKARMLGGIVKGSGSSLMGDSGTLNRYNFVVDKSAPVDVRLAAEWFDTDGMLGKIVGGPAYGNLLWVKGSDSPNEFIGTFQMDDGLVLGQKCSSVTVGINSSNGLLKLTSGVAIGAGEERPFMAKVQGQMDIKDNGEAAFDIEAYNGDLGSALQNYGSDIDGKLDFKGSLKRSFGKWTAKGEVNSKVLSLYGFNLDSASGLVYLDDGLIKTDKLVFARGVSKNSFTGSVSIKKPYSTAGTLTLRNSSISDFKALLEKLHLAEGRGAAARIAEIMGNGGSISADIDFDNASGPLEFKGTAAAEGISVNQLPVDGNAEFSFSQGDLQIRDLSLRGKILQLSVNGRLDTDGDDTRLRIKGTGLPTSLLAMLTDKDFGISGVASFDGVISGKLVKPSITGEVSLKDGSVFNIDFDSLGADIKVSDGILTIRKGNMSEGSSRIDFGGFVGFNSRGNGLEITGDVVNVNLADVAKMDKKYRDLPIKGIVTGHFSAGGALSNPTLNFKGKIKEMAYKNGLLGDASIDLRKSGNAVNLEKFELTEGTGKLFGTGSLEHGNKIHLQMRSESYSVDEISKLLKIDLKGKLNIDAQVTGDTHNPVIALSATLKSGSLKGIPFDYLLTTVIAEKGLANIQSAKLSSGQTYVIATGSVPVPDSLGLYRQVDSSGDLTGINLDVRVSEGSLALLPLVTNQVEKSSGGGELKFNIHGTYNEPKLEGYGDIVNGTLKLKSLPYSLTDVSAKVDFLDNKVSISNMSASANDGRIKGMAVIYLSSKGKTKVTSSLQYSDLALPKPMEALATGHIEVDGYLTRPKLKGRVLLTKGQITVPSMATGKDKQGKEDSNPFDADLDMLIEIGKDIKFKQPFLADVDLRGNVTLGGTMRHPTLDGSVDSKRGSFTYLGTDFRLTSGRIDFDPKTGLNPNIEAAGETTISGTHLYLILRGSVDNLQTEIRSNPSLSEREIRSLLSIPSKVESFTDGNVEENIKAGMQDLLVDQIRKTVVGGVEDIFREALRLDEFELQNDQDAGYKISLGKYITNDVYISYSNNLKAETLQDVKVEYTLKPGVSISGQVDNKRDFRIFLDTNFKF